MKSIDGVMFFVWVAVIAVHIVLWKHLPSALLALAIIGLSTVCAWRRLDRWTDPE